MNRNLKRVYRNHGIKYFAFPIVVLLLVLALADQLLDGYTDRRTEAAELEDRLGSNRNILELNSKVLRSRETLSSDFTSVQSQIFVASDITQSVNTMQGQLRTLLQSLYFDNIEFFDIADATKGSISRIEMSARFTGVPQQLPRLQAALAQSTPSLAIDSLDIRVVDDLQRGGQQLAVTARFAGLHMKPLPEPVAANASKKSEIKP